MMRHLRGHVRFMGRYAFGEPVYEFRVINRSTGRVVARDDLCGWDKAHGECRVMVQTVRHAWLLGLKAKDLKR